MSQLVDAYKLELLIFLGTMGIYKGTERVNVDKSLNDDKLFIKKKFIHIKSGNVDEEALDKAIDELLPYLRMDDIE